MKAILTHFFKRESASAILLMAMLLLAMVAANSPWAAQYAMLRSHTGELVINDGLMALFFLVIAIEMKREMREGSLAGRGQVALPLVAAFGGVVVPSLLYVAVNQGGALRGWAIPTATDIALSLGLLTLFGKRVPPALRVFLMSIAVFDDMIAMAVIALFYNGQLHGQGVGMAAGCVVILYGYNRCVGKLAPYLFGGAALWVALLDAGISPTLAGVVLGLALPLELGKRVGRALHYPVAFGVVPLFVFANSGITFGMLDWRAVGDWVSIGIMLGLVAGKPLGIFMAAFAFIKLGFARLPTGCGWLHLCAVAAMAGVGFTMSLFIASLAFGSDERMVSAQIGVILGSLASAAIGTICMAHVLHKKEKSVL